MKNTIGRRKFFITAGLSAVAVTMLNSAPLKFFSNYKRKSGKGITLNIHPSAVKRNK